MQPLRNIKHETFAQRLIAGDSQLAAYRTAYRYTGSDLNGTRLAYRLAHRSDITSRVEYLQRRAAHRVGWTLEKRLTFLMQCTTTPPSQIDAESPLCLGTRQTVHGTELKLIDKIRAIELYSRLAGDLTDKPEPVATTPLGEIMARIRVRKDP